MRWIWVDRPHLRGSAVVTDRKALAAAVRRPGGPGVNEVARRVGVTPPAISMLITGSRESCWLDTASSIARAVGGTFDDFFSVRTSPRSRRDSASEDTPARRTA